MNTHEYKSIIPDNPKYSLESYEHIEEYRNNLISHHEEFINDFSKGLCYTVPEHWRRPEQLFGCYHPMINVYNHLRRHTKTVYTWFLKKYPMNSDRDDNNDFDCEFVYGVDTDEN